MYTKIFYNPTFLFLMLCFIVCNPVEAGLHFIVQNVVIAATVALIVYQKAETDPLTITIALVVLGCHRIAILLAITLVGAQSLREIWIKASTMKPTTSEPMVIDKSVPNIDLSKLLCSNMLNTLNQPNAIDQILKSPGVNSILSQLVPEEIRDEIASD